MKNKYIALDILLLAGVETPGDKIGKFRVNIAGVTVNKPDHIVNLQDAKSVDIIVGDKKYTAEIPAEQSEESAIRVQEALKVKGEAATKARIASGKVEAPKEETKEEATE